jgi:hypothetical protein
MPQLHWEHIFADDQTRQVVLTVNGAGVQSIRYADGSLLDGDDYDDVKESIVENADFAGGWNKFIREYQDDYDGRAELVQFAASKGWTPQGLMRAVDEDPDRLNHKTLAEAVALLVGDGDIDWLWGVVDGYKAR